MSPTRGVWLPPHPALARLTWADFMVLAIVSALDGPSQEAIHNRVAVDRGSLSVWSETWNTRD